MTDWFGVDMQDNTCSVNGCDKPLRSKGLCYGHYMKAWRYGTPTPTHAQTWEDLTGRRFGSLVAVQRVDARWLCDCDCGARTIVRVGDLNRGSALSCGDMLHRRKEIVGYGAAHERVRAARGHIASHRCVDCDAQAGHWSYNHDDPNELTTDELSANTVAYSLNPEHYSPRCVSCHKRFDLGRIDSATRA